jgi:CDP-glycerol glycerophosphotransferase
MADPLLIIDIFITNYSSLAGDYILKGKPMILFQPDRDKYLITKRTFYFNVNESPFIAVNSQKELIEKILLLKEDHARKNCSDIMEYYGVYETGKALEKIVE